MRALRAADAMTEAKKRGESGFSQFFANAKDNPLETVGQFTESALPTIGAAVAGAAAAPFTGGASLALPFVVGGVQGAGETRNEIYDHIMTMPQAQLSQSPEYQALLAKGLSEQKARQALASSITEHGREVLATGLLINRKVAKTTFQIDNCHNATEATIEVTRVGGSETIVYPALEITPDSVTFMWDDALYRGREGRYQGIIRIDGCKPFCVPIHLGCKCNMGSSEQGYFISSECMGC